jgi:hypothetical protein
VALTRWLEGCGCDPCRLAMNAATKARGRARAQKRLPVEREDRQASCVRARARATRVLGSAREKFQMAAILVYLECECARPGAWKFPDELERWTRVVGFERGMRWRKGER